MAHGSAGGSKIDASSERKLEFSMTQLCKRLGQPSDTNSPSVGLPFCTDLLRVVHVADAQRMFRQPVNTDLQVTAQATSDLEGQARWISSGSSSSCESPAQGATAPPRHASKSRRHAG